MIEKPFRYTIYIGVSQIVGLRPQSSDMLSKNTWDVKKCEANQKQHCKQAGVTKNFDISLGQEVTLSRLLE